VGNHTPQTEATGHGNAGEHRVEQVLLATRHVEHVLNAKHGCCPEAHFGSHLQAFSHAAIGDMVVFALVVEIPPRRRGRELVRVFGSEAKTGHLASMSRAEAHANDERQAGGQR
jgi:hypothetical protein